MATDPIIKDYQLWIGFVQPEGLVVSPAALKNAQAVLSHNVGVQQEILRRHAVPDFGSNLERSTHVKRLLRESGIGLHAMQVNRNGEPSHPLYLPLKLQPFIISEPDAV